MKQQKQDRRSQRTIRLINAAMIDLLSEKRYTDITVQDILDRADVGRSTFYTHYYDKEDVFEGVAEQMLASFNQQLQQAEAGQLLPALELFRHVQEGQRLFQNLLGGQGEEMIWKAVQTILSRSIEQSLVSMLVGKRPPSVPLAVMAQYLAGAFLNLLKWWIEAEMPYSPERMDEIFQQLALPGVLATTEKKSQ